MTSSLKLFKILYYIEQIDSKLPCVCSVRDHRGRQNVVDLLLNRRTATWNLFVKQSTVKASLFVKSSRQLMRVKDNTY